MGKKSCPEWEIWGKQEGYRFSDIIDFPNPLIESGLSFNELRLRAGTVIKPRSGSDGEGVFLIYDEDDIWDVYRRCRISGFCELRDQLSRYMADFPNRNHSWSIEELVFDRSRPRKAALDWKFYCFYGEIELIGAIQRRPILADVWMDESGEIVDLGFASASELSPKPSIPEGLVIIAQKI